MKFVNLTPHTINIMHGEEEVLTLAPSGHVARVEQHLHPIDSVGGINVAMVETGQIQNLPEPEEGVAFIVSGMVEAQADRNDVYSPGPLVRDQKGKPVGCEGLKQTK